MVVDMVGSVLETLKSADKPITAKLIAREVRKDTNLSGIRKSDVNSILYNELQREVHQDADFQWSLV